MRILIAEDESIIRLDLKAMLSELSHDVFVAKDGHDVLTKARISRPDMAILDIMMPFADDLETTVALASKHPMPVILMTGFSDHELIERAIALPIHGYLIKPIQLPELEAAIAVATSRFQETRELEKRIAELEYALETRKLVDRAKGQLMALGMSEAKAFRTIQDRARRTRKSMQEVSLAILG